MRAKRIFILLGKGKLYDTSTDKEAQTGHDYRAEHI